MMIEKAYVMCPCQKIDVSTYDLSKASLRSLASQLPP